MKLRFNKNIMCLSLLISFCFVRAIPVAPIVDGEGIWRVVSRIGECVDSLANGCEATITQADIGSGGTFTISGTANVTYCLAEDVEFNTGNAITIDGVQHVTIDLNGHSINGTDLGDYGIFIQGSGNEDITIQNGLIRNCVDQLIIVDRVPVNGFNLRNLELLNTTDEALYLEGTDTEIIKNVFIENCRMIDTDGMFSDGLDGAIVRNCEVESSNGSGGELQLRGPSDINKSRYFCVQDCILTGSFSVDGTGCFDFYDADVVTLERCKVIGVTGDAFYLDGINTVYIADCVGMDVNNGFSLYNVQSGIIARTHFAKCGSTAFFIDGCSNMTFRDCSVCECESYAFQVENASSNIVFDSCHVISADYGFDFDSSTSACKVINCCTERSLSAGYHSTAPLGANIFLGNSSFADALGFDANIDAGLILTGVAEVAGANKWTNVVFP